MMNDLRNNRILEGASRQQVFELLGEPAPGSSGGYLRYPLGYTGNGINTGTLIIFFDENERVQRYMVREG